MDTGCPSETLHHPKDPRGPGEKPHRPDFLEMVDMPLDSGYVLIQPCVACWREPTAMSRLLRVSWLSAGRHSILELATGEETGEMASQRARHPGTLADRCRRSFPQQAVLPECHPQWPWGTCPPAVLPHRGPRADVRPPAPPRGSQEPPGHSLWVLSRPGRRAACMGLLQRPWGPSCSRQGPDRRDAPTTLMLESLLKGLPGRVAMDRASLLLAHRPQPRVD